jgi:hypothetical protein
LTTQAGRYLTGETVSRAVISVSFLVLVEGNFNFDYENFRFPGGDRK